MLKKLKAKFFLYLLLDPSDVPCHAIRNPPQPINPAGLTQNQPSQFIQPLGIDDLCRQATFHDAEAPDIAAIRPV